MSLSSNLKNSNEPACLRATGCGVEYIDKLPQGQINCIKLCLSYNSISSLENITQFKRLNVLLIQYNLISTFEALMPLRELRYLRTLRLEGNPVCNLALFDVHVVYMLPNLQLLNGKRTKEIMEQKDLRYIDYESELIDQISSINFVYEVFKYVLDIYNRDSVPTPVENKSVSRINSSSNTPTRSNRSNVIKSSSPASVSSRQNTKSVSSKPANNIIFDLIKEAMKIKRVEILDNKAYKSELTQSLRKNKFTDEGYISFLRLEVLRLDKLIEESVITIIRFTQPPGSPRKDSAFSTPVKSPQHSNKDSTKQLGNENNSTLTDELEMYRYVLSNLKGEEDFDEFVAQQEDLQASSFRIMGIIGGMELEKIGADSSNRSNTTPSATPKKLFKSLSNRNKKFVSDDNDEEEIEDNFNMAMTPSAEVREEKAGFVHNQHARRAKTPAIPKKRNASSIESSPSQKNQTPATPIASSPTSNPTPSKALSSNKTDDFDTPNTNKDKKARVSKDLKRNDEQSQKEKANQNNNETNENQLDHPFEIEEDEDLLKSESDNENDKHPFEVDNDNEMQKSGNEQNNKESGIQIFEEEEEIEDEEEKERQRQLELQKQKEKLEKQKQLELQKQKEEEERQKQLEQQKQQEQERKRQLQKQKKEQERQRQLELQKQKEEEERQKQLELQKQKEEEEERQRQLELQKQKEEEERQRQLELQRQKEEEEKQKQLELQKQQQEKEKRRQLRKQKQLELQKQKEEEEKQKQLELQKQKEEEEKQKQLELQKQKEEEEKQKQLKLQKQKEEEEKQKQLELQKQKEEEEKQKQLELQKQQQEQERKRRLQKQKQEQEKQKQLELQKQKEEQERQKQLELQKQKEEQERQKQLELQKQKEEEKKRLQEEEKQRKLEQEKQNQLLKQKQQEEAERQKELELKQHQKSQLKQDQIQSPQRRLNVSDGDIDKDLQEIVNKTSCDTLLINKISSDEEENENENIGNEEQVNGDEEEEKLEPIVPIDMKQIINFDEEIFSSGNSDNEEEDIHDNKVRTAKKSKKIGLNENENNGNTIDEDDKKKEKENSILNRPKGKSSNQRSSSRHESENSSVQQVQSESEKVAKSNKNFDFEEEEEDILVSDVERIGNNQISITGSQIIEEEEEDEDENYEEVEQSKEAVVYPSQEEEKSKVSPHSKDKTNNRRSNDEQNEQNSYSPSSSAGNFVFQEPPLSTGEKEEEEEEETNEKVTGKSNKSDSASKKCSIVVTPTAIQVPKEARGSSSECAEYLDSGPDDEEESNNQSGKNRSDSKHQKHKTKSSQQQQQQQKKPNFNRNEEEEEEERNQKRKLKKVSDQDGLNQDFEDHESNDLANYVDNTATLSLDEKMQASIGYNEEEESYEGRSYEQTNSTPASSFEKARPEMQNNQEADNVFDYSLEEIDNVNENSKNDSNSKKGKMDEGYNFQFANASSDMRLGAFASSEKLNNSEEIADSFNYPKQVKSSITAPSGSHGFDNSKVGDLSEEDISEDSDSFQRKIMSCIPQSIQNITKQQEKAKQPKRSILFDIDQAPSSGKGSNEDGKGNEIKIEIDADNLARIEIDEMVYDGSRGESMSSSKDKLQNRQKQKQSKSRSKSRNKVQQQELVDYTDGTKFDAESGGGFATPLQSQDLPTSSFFNQYDQDQDQDQHNHQKGRRQKHSQQQQQQQQRQPFESSSSRLQKKSNHSSNNNNSDNDDYNSYADESRDFHENDNFNDNDGSYSNYKRIGGSKTDLACFGSNAFDASNGGIDMTNADSNEPHWLNSCDDTKFDASYGGAYDSAQPHKNNQQRKKKGGNKQGIVFNNPNNDNEIDFISRDQSTETDFQHQVRFANNDNSHRQQHQQHGSDNKNQKQFAAFTDSNSDLLNDDDDDDDEASSSRAATSNAFSSSLYPIMKNSNSILSMTQDNASSSRAEPDSDFHFKLDENRQQQQQRKRKRMQVLPVSQLFVARYFNTWKSKSKLLNPKRQNQSEATSTSTVINESYIQPRSFQYQLYKASITSTGFDTLKYMSERRELLRRIEMQKEINNALENRLSQIAKEREASANYSMSFGCPPSSPLSSSVNRERIRYQQIQQQQLLQQQRNKKEKKQDLFTQYRNHVMSSGINKEYE